jgi:hypothetical protein
MNSETERHAVCCSLIQDAADAGGDVSLMVRGASMLPAVWPGDVVTVRRCEFADLQPSQIALFHRDGKLTAHRIQKISNNEIITRGDALACFDPPVRASEIVGRVESIYRNGRKFSPEQRLWQRVAAWTLRNSDLSMRTTLFLGRRLRRSWDMQAGTMQTVQANPSPAPTAKR